MLLELALVKTVSYTNTHHHHPRLFVTTPLESLTSASHLVSQYSRNLSFTSQSFSSFCTDVCTRKHTCDVDSKITMKKQHVCLARLSRAASAGKCCSTIIYSLPVVTPGLLYRGWGIEVHPCCLAVVEMFSPVVTCCAACYLNPADAWAENVSKEASNPEIT